MPRLSLSLLTLNLLYAAGSQAADEGNAGAWEERLPLILELCDQWQPDVLAFQECQDVQWRDLERELGARGYTGCVGPKNGTDRAPLWTRFAAPVLWMGAAFSLRYRSKFGVSGAVLLAILGFVPVAFTLILRRAKGQACEDGGHCPLFFRAEKFRIENEGAFWISNQPQTPDSLLPGAWLPRICHWIELRERETDARFQVFNTHLDWWFLARSRGGKIVAAQMNALEIGAPQVLLGDFNAPRHSSTWRALMEESERHKLGVFFDALENAERKNGPDDTFHGGNGKPGYPGRIDHILLRPKPRVEWIETDELHRGEVFPSDHFPVVARVEFHHETSP